jgi:NADH dehydrogenase FAD-containing subunit
LSVPYESNISSNDYLRGGFVGLFAALHLGQQTYPRPIILIEQRDRFVFKPLLYELLTGEMHVEQICPFYTELLARSNVSFVQDAVQSVAYEADIKKARMRRTAERISRAVEESKN